VTKSPTPTRTLTGTIYVSRLLTDRAMNHLHALGAPLRIGSEAPPDRGELEAGIAGASAAVITLTERVDADLIAAAGPQLKVIANVAVGFDNIDLSAAEAAGVTVTNTPGVLDRASADHTFAWFAVDNLGFGGRGCWSGSTSALAPHSASSVTAASVKLWPGGRTPST
jgi:D-isomer specific 2-hydroxyacid dehydrogenase, catalytic domain